MPKQVKKSLQLLTSLIALVFISLGAPTFAETQQTKSLAPNDSKINLVTALQLAKINSLQLQLANEGAAVELQKSYDVIQTSLPHLKMNFKLNPISSDYNTLMGLQKVAGIIRDMITGEDDEETSDAAEASEEESSSSGIPYGKDNCVTVEVVNIIGYSVGPCVYVPAAEEVYFKEKLFQRTPQELIAMLIDYGYVEGEATRAVRVDLDVFLHQNLIGNFSSLLYFEKRKNFDLAVEKIRETEQAVQLQAAQTYTILYFQQLMVYLFEEQLAKLEEYQTKATALNKAGYFLSQELQKLQITVLKMKEQLLESNQQLITARSNFEGLIGFNPQTLPRPLSPLVRENYNDLNASYWLGKHSKLKQAEIHLSFLNQAKSINPLLGYLNWDLNANLKVGWDFVRPWLGTGEIVLNSRLDLQPLKAITMMIRQRALNFSYHAKVVATNNSFKELDSLVKKAWLKQKKAAKTLALKKQQLKILAQNVDLYKEKYSADSKQLPKVIAAELTYFRFLQQVAQIEKELILAGYRLYSELDLLNRVIK